MDSTVMETGQYLVEVVKVPRVAAILTVRPSLPLQTPKYKLTMV